MTAKAEFNADEWAQVLEGPLMAGMLVIAADRGGTIRESLSMGKAYTEARQQDSTSELLDAIVSSNPQLDPSNMRSGDELRQHATQRLGLAVATVERVAAPHELAEYKAFIRALADKVAHAHREGGVLGIGGKDVSDSEQAALNAIDAAIDQSATRHDSQPSGTQTGDER